MSSIPGSAFESLEALGLLYLEDPLFLGMAFRTWKILWRSSISLRSIGDLSGSFLYLEEPLKSLYI